MPQHKSAAKRVRQNARRRENNRRQRSNARTMMKNLRAVEDVEDKEEAAAQLNDVKAALDRLASKGLIHKNKAAHYKSKLERHVNALE